MRFLFSLIVLLCLFTSAVHAQSFMNITAETGDSFNAVLVEKEGKWLHVIKVAEGRTEVLKSFQVLTGRVNGDKEVRGDEKTPEGLYFVTGFLSPEKLKEMYGDVGKQYGTGAFPLSYPNLKDKLNSKTGGGIWLHGIDPERAETVTKGCVAFENDKLTMLKDYITVGTPVIITSAEGMQGTIEDIQEHFLNMKRMVNEYLTAWEENDFEAFKSFYHASFKSVGGRNFGSYLAYKKNLMDIFPYRKVFAGNFRFFNQSADEMVAEFDQYYCAANVYSYGRKKFYFEREIDSLKVVAEEFRPMDGSGFIREKVNEFLLGWKAAWEAQNIDEYITYYSDKFITRGMDKAAWKADKTAKFEKLNEVHVGIENIAFKAYSPVSYSIEFKQRYQGDSYKDVGTKTLRITGCPGDFKITSENWRAVQ